MGRIVYNGIRTPDGTVIESWSRHDFVAHTDKNGDLYAVDGGLDYLRRLAPREDYIEMSLWEDSNYSLIRQRVKRWNRESNTSIRLMDISQDWLEAIIKHYDDKGVSNQITDMYKKEKEYRERVQ